MEMAQERGGVKVSKPPWNFLRRFVQKSEEAELFGAGFVLGELHGSLFGEGEQFGDRGGLARFFERFDDAGEEASAVDAVDFGAVKFAGGEAEVGDEGAELVVDHAVEDDAGERTAVEDDSLRCAGVVLVDGPEQEFEVEGRVVGDEREVAAEVGEVAEDGLDAGAVDHHVVGDAVDGGCAGRDGASGIDERAKCFAGFGAVKANGSDFNNGIGFGLDAGGFEVKGYKVHAVSYTGYGGGAQDCAQNFHIEETKSVARQRRSQKFKPRMNKIYE